MRGRALSAGVLLAWAGVALAEDGGGAPAGGDAARDPARVAAPSLAPSTPDALLRAAQAAERDALPVRAHGLYRAVEAAAPGSRLAARAAERRQWLEERGVARDPGAVALLLRALGPGLDAAALGRLETDALALPAGPVRHELLTTLAHQWSAQGSRPAPGRRGDLLRAVRLLEALCADPGFRGAPRRAVVLELAELYAARDGRARAIALLEREGLGGSEAARALRAASRHAALTWAAASWLLLFVPVALYAGRVERQVLCGAAGALLRGPLVPVLALVTVPPLVLAARYEPRTFDTFALFAAGLTALVFLAGLVGRGLRARGAPRWSVVALACGAGISALALAYLVAGWAPAMVSFAP